MDSKIFLRKYRVSAEEIEAVGESGDGPLVYEGEEIDSGKRMVVEVVPAAALKMAMRARLEAEAIAAKKLDHPNIPTLYDFGVEGDDLVYVTEDFDGTPAEEWVNTHGPMPAGPVLRIASQVVSALGKAAFHRIVHRAINPSNIVLVPGQTAQGEWPLVKVLHFVGVVPRISAPDVSSSAFDKSLPYTSPEQLQQRAVDFRSEIYSLGGTMWFLLTGGPPPTAATTPLAADKVSALPKEVSRLLGQMLSANPDARPRDPLAFHQRLQDCLTRVERPERMPRKFGVAVPQIDAIGRPKNQLTARKALAHAALLLTTSAIAALVLRGYVWQRVVRANEPIGVPIAVTRAFPSASPVRAKKADPMVQITTSPSPAVAASNRTKSGRAKDNANPQPPATDFVEPASPKQVPVVPVLTISGPPASLQTRETAPAPARNVGPSPPSIDLWKLAATTELALAPAPAKLRDAETSTVAQPTPPKKTIGHEVRRAELAEPEIRLAEPAHPKERPTAVAPDTTAPLSQPTNSATPPE